MTGMWEKKGLLSPYETQECFTEGNPASQQKNWEFSFDPWNSTLSPHA